MFAASKEKKKQFFFFTVFQAMKEILIWLKNKVETVEMLKLKF